MTNEQLTQEVMNLKEHQAKSVAEHEKFELILKELQEDVKSTKTLAEDVHIMAINMQNMQKTLEETNKKVDALSSKEFVEYKENKKLIKQNIITKVTSAIVGAVIGIGGILLTLYFKGGF
jgi:predicted RNase H-like nuclease (RuvC/YqgF family)